MEDKNSLENKAEEEKKKKSKLHGMSPNNPLKSWERERQLQFRHGYHNQRLNPNLRRKKIYQDADLY